MPLKNILLFYPKYIKKAVSNTSNIMTLITSVSDFAKLILFLKKSTFFKYQILTDIVCVDYSRAHNRFKLTYVLTSIKYNNRIYVSTYLNENNYPNSIENLYSVANWMEREVWDMYGIFFIGNRDLRRILTDYGFKGFPFRKDFPLNGFVELRYDEEKKHLIYEPLELSQEIRVFDFVSNFQKEIN